MKKTRIFQLAGAVTTLMGIAAACSFPQPTFVDPADGGGTDTGAGDAIGPNEEAGGGDTGSKDGGGGVELDAPAPFDATSEKPPVEAGCICDCDEDGYRTGKEEAGACDAAMPVGDCDDLDKRAHPDAGFVYDLPTPDTQGDWNCDKTYSLQYSLGIKCSDYSSLLGGGCAHEGFQEANVGCGVESNTWVSCKAPAVAGTCETATPEKRKQGCK